MPGDEPPKGDPQPATDPADEDSSTPFDDPPGYVPREKRWDANDPRRQKDCFAPPQEPCECWCMHCNRTFMSDGIWFQPVKRPPGKQKRPGEIDGFWMCPTPNCDGAGFTFDIFPTDPDHPANEGWQWFDDDDDESEDGLNEEDGDSEVSGVLSGGSDDTLSGDTEEYDPSEAKYKQLDEECEQEEELVEGDEWKLGNSSDADTTFDGSAWESGDEKKYDMPDLRPREVEWTERDDSMINEEDIPF
jgi:hypothetical protein